MSSGTKLFLTFVGGAALGAGALALLNRGKWDFEYLKPLATTLLNDAGAIKESFLAKVDELANKAQPDDNHPAAQDS